MLRSLEEFLECEEEIVASKQKQDLNRRNQAKEQQLQQQKSEEMELEEQQQEEEEESDFLMKDNIEDEDGKINQLDLSLTREGNVEGAIPGMVRIFLPSIFALLRSLKDPVRVCALKVVQRVLAQGLVFPMDCVKYAIAALTDKYFF